MKLCPFCGEQIQPAAVKCRFCGEWLDPSQRPAWSGHEIAALTEHIAREVARQLAPRAAEVEDGSISPTAASTRPPRRRSSTRDIPSDATSVSVVAPDNTGRAAGSVEFEPQPAAEPSTAPAYEAPGPYPGLGHHEDHGRALGQPAPRSARWKPGAEDSEPKPAAPSWQPPLSEEPAREPEKQATVSDAVWQAPAWLRPEEQPAAPRSNPPAWAPPAHEAPPPTWAAPATASPATAPTWSPPAAAVAEPPVWTPEPRPRAPRIPELGLEPEVVKAELAFPKDDDEFVDGGFGDEFDDDEFDDEPAAPRSQPKLDSGPARKAKPNKQVEAKAQPEARPEAKTDARPKAKPPKDDDDFDDDFDDDDDDFDDDDDDDDSSMTGASGIDAVSIAAPQPRKLPWIPIAAVSGALVMLTAYVFRDALFGPTDDSAQTDETEALAETEPETQPEPPPPEPEPEKIEEKQPEPPPPAIPPEELEAKVAEATNLVNRQKHADASKIIDEVLAKIPKEPRALALLAIIQLEKRKHQEALETANDCVAVDPSQAQCWIAIAVVEQENNNLARSLEGYRKYLELEPKGAYAKVAKGQVERLSRQVEG